MTAKYLRVYTSAGGSDSKRMNQTNRTVIILIAAIWIVLMAVAVFVAWAADKEAVDKLQDFVNYLDDHRDNASRLILTLGALVLVVLALLVIIVEVAPEDETRELKVEQAGTTTIVPAEALRLRLEEALLGLPQVSAARARVFSRDKGIGSSLDLTVAANTNVAWVTQEATRVVVDALQTDLGLPVAGVPTVRIVFAPPGPQPVASSMAQPPLGSEGTSEAPEAQEDTATTAGEPPLEQAPSPSAEGGPASGGGSEQAAKPPAEEEPPGQPPQP